MTLKLSDDVLKLNPDLDRRAKKLAKLDGDGYKSELERRFVREWIMPQVSEGMIVTWWYEPMSFNLKGGRYTPDFMILWSLRGRVSFAEVKGWTKSLRADHRAFLEAAHTHLWASWLWATYDKGWVEDWAK